MRVVNEAAGGAMFQFVLPADSTPVYSCFRKRQDWLVDKSSSQESRLLAQLLTIIFLVTCARYEP